MKTNHLLLCGLALLGIACQKSESEAPSGSITLAASYEDRTYQYDETIPVTLAITEQYAASDHCFLTITCVEGNASVSLEGEQVELGAAHAVDYAINNEAQSSKTLICQITTLPQMTAAPTLKVIFKVSSAAGGTISTQELKINVDNNSPVQASVVYNKTPIETAGSLLLNFTFKKEGYTGAYAITYDIASGAGYCVVHGQNYQSDKSFNLDSESTITYQPTTFGKHELSFRVTAGNQSATVDVTCEIYNDMGMETPASGAYIYAKSYSNKPFLTLQEWEAGGRPEVNGIAIFDSNMRVMISPKVDMERGFLMGKADRFYNVPDLAIVEDYRNDTNMDGKGNTEKVMAALKAGKISKADGFAHCYNYDSQNQEQWYLPTITQLDNILKYRSTISQMTTAVSGVSFLPVGSGYFFSSTAVKSTEPTNIVAVMQFSATSCFRSHIITYQQTNDYIGYSLPICDVK